MMRSIRVVLAMALLAPAGAAAQSPLSAELRLGLGVPTQDFGEAELGNGIGFEASLRYQLPLCLSLYAGWDWYHFSSDQGGVDFDFEDTGYAVGLLWKPMRLDGYLGPWIRGGMVYDHVEIEDGEGDLVADSDHAFGYEVGAGLTLPLTGRFSLTPGVRYRAFSPEMESGGTTADAVELSYLALEIGLAIDF